MSLATGFILMGVIVVLGSIALAGFAIWIRNRDTETEHHARDGAKHA